MQQQQTSLRECAFSISDFPGKAASNTRQETPTLIFAGLTFFFPPPI